MPNVVVVVVTAEEPPPLGTPLGVAVEKSLNVDAQAALLLVTNELQVVLEVEARKAVTRKHADRRDDVTETDSSMETATPTTNTNK